MKITNYFKQKFDSLDFLFDSHAHLSWFEENKSTRMVEESIKNGVEKIIDIAVDLKTSKATLANARKFPGIVFPTAGIDPEIAIPGSELFIENLDSEEVEKMLTQLEVFIEENHQDLIMIGECGLDYYWIYKNDLSEEEVEKSKKLQKQIFAKQIELAVKYNLPLSIHHRDSLDDCLEMLAEFGATHTVHKTSLSRQSKVEAIFHSFTGDIEDARKITGQGFSIGINGIVTYKSAEDIRLAVKNILTGKKIESPEDFYQTGIFLETDAPFLSPRGAKSRENSPDNIKIIFDFLKKEVLG